MEYYGPSTKFESATGFGRAAAICELENIECRLDPYTNTIHFKSTKAEEKFTIASSMLHLPVKSFESNST